MKPLKVALFVLSLVISSRSQAQCGCPRYPALVAFGQTRGVGWEVGWWPADSRLGLFGGMAVESVKNNDVEKQSSARMMQTFVYLKLQARVVDHVAVTTSVGLRDVQQKYYNLGLRFNYPLTEKLAAVAEPQMGNRGFHMLGGLAARLSN